MYEVELKFPVADPVEVERRVAGLGGTFAAPVEQIDRYFAHPARDFAVTDEALRLRAVGNEVVVTWKGPRIDATTKTRREIELGLAPAAGGPAAGAVTVARWTDLLEALGFRPVRAVAKRRRIAVVRHAGVEVEAALDDVAGLGSFLELEAQAAAADVPRARAAIESLARDLGCGAPERRSYLELVLASG